MLRPAAFIAALLLGASGLPAHAQVAAPTTGDSPIACPSQQELEQVIGSDGQILPEGCTLIDVSRLRSDGEALCLIDFSLDQGFLGRLRDAAFPSQWWVRCADLEAALD